MDRPVNTESMQAVREAVGQGYARIARGEAGAGAECCCATGRAVAVARSVGYGEDELAQLPEGANMGLSCGNPTALASLRPGEVVLDLGCGGGFDVFIASRKVGPEGRAIGVDMTPQMLSRARGLATAHRERTGLSNVEFRLGEIEHLPVADSMVDVVISNCVINLSPDKARVWREIARVLRPGGRVAVSDLALLKPLPAAIVAKVEALVGCVAGAVLVEKNRRLIAEAGLVDAQLEVDSTYTHAMSEWQDPLYRELQEHLPEGTTLADYVVSLKVSARKPARCCCSNPSRSADE